MKQSKGKTIFDWIVIILGMSYGVSILSELFYIEGFGVTIPFTAFLLFAHCIRFGFRFSIFKEIPRSPLLFLYFIIIFLDFLQAILNIGNGGNIQNASVRVVYLTLYASYIWNLYKERSLSYILRPYFSYSLYNVITIAIMAILIVAGVSWQQNEVAYQLLLDDMQDGIGAVYYFPYYISIVALFHDYSILPFIPGITGLSHEPHVIMWIISPAMIMLLAYKSKKKWITLFAFLYLFVLLETFSTMSILAFGAVFFLQMLWMSKDHKARRFIIPIITLITVAAIVFAESLDLITEVVKAKTDVQSAQGGSSDYSMNMLKYLTSFKGLFGYGNLPPASDDISEAVSPNVSAGIITGVLDIVLFLILIINSFRLSLSNSKAKHYIGLGFLYMLIHGIKVNYGVFGYPIFTLLIIVIHTIMASKGANIKDISEKPLFED